MPLQNKPGNPNACLLIMWFVYNYKANYNMYQMKSIVFINSRQYISFENDKIIHIVQQLYKNIKTLSRWNILRVSGPLCGESIDHWLIPLTKASDAELRCFIWSAPEKETAEQAIKPPVIWDATAHYDGTVIIKWILIYASKSRWWRSGLLAVY